MLLVRRSQLSKRSVDSPVSNISTGLLKKKSKMFAYSTRCSQALSHPSTNRARRCLTSVIGREPKCTLTDNVKALRLTTEFHVHQLHETQS
ncbi:hypothetical protein C0Q70_00277 [Pomacea canaliculata]|uniref:Uncharacterized protein n=1 Tax=Pomacea canaliculata TaxID=400727 RepID=A0A2T7PW88_POMCA|nr:hypothetical protein C0Q70_00277 [Pomacea canaliculata]